jgi:hypothetical protein
MSQVVGTQGLIERTRPDGRVIEVRYNPAPDGSFVLMYGDIIYVNYRVLRRPRRVVDVLPSD